MKKIILSGVLALGLALVSGQQAQAWVNFKVGIGANLQWQSGGNSLLWGMFRGQQPGGFGGYDGNCGPGGCGLGHGFGLGHGHEYPFFGAAPTTAPVLAAPSAPPAATTPAVTNTQPTYWYGGYNPYHLTSYGANPYYGSSYYYPSYQGYYYAPSYWYGR